MEELTFSMWKRRRPDAAREIKYVITESGCWECTSHKRNRDGYPQTTDCRKTVRIHRKVYELTKGKIFPGNVVLHKCDNPKCINPDHLIQGSQKENVHDMVRKGRGFDRSGINNPRSILSEKDVYEIKHLLKYTNFYYREIGVMYGVEKTAIFAINKGKRFQHIKI